MKFEISNRWTGAIIFEKDADTMRLAVEAALADMERLAKQEAAS